MVNAVCNNIRRARKPSVTSELAISLGLEVRPVCGLYVIRCVRVVSSAGLNLAKLGLLVKMDIGGRRLKAVCVVESQEGTSGVSRGASAPRPHLNATRLLPFVIYTMQNLVKFLLYTAGVKHACMGVRITCVCANFATFM